MMRGLLLMLCLLCPALSTLVGSRIAWADADSAETAAAPDPNAYRWPIFELSGPDTADPNTIVRGPGWYLSIFKIIFTWLLILAWIRAADWINRDCQTHRLNYMQWNSVAVFPFFVAVILAWLIPLYGVGLVLMLLAFAGSLGAYVYFRNQLVEDHEKVFTPDHFRHLFAAKAKKAGVKVAATKQTPQDAGAPVEFTACGGATERDNTANLLLSRQSPGFVPAKDLLAEGIRSRSDVLMLDYSAETVAVRYQIDGVWHAAPARDRATGDVLLAVYKTLAALDANQRSTRQAGLFRAALDGRKYECKLVSQGTETGERVVIKLESRTIAFKHLLDLGMRDKVAEQFKGILNDGTGIIVFSAMPAGGLTSLLHVSLEESDRLMRNYFALEEEQQREIDIENVEVRPYNAAAGQTPLTILPEVLKNYPEVLVVPQLPDAATVSALCEQVSEENRTVLTTVRAKEAPESLLRIMMLKVPPAEFASALRAALNVRLIRRLCETCKVAYEPTPDLLQKLGIPAGRVPALYREPTAEERPTPCEKCGGVGYYGRTGLFELLVVDDKVREVLVKQPQLELLKKAARAAGMRTLQEEGILLVAKGTTSVTELMRILKQ